MKVYYNESVVTTNHAASFNAKNNYITAY